MTRLTILGAERQSAIEHRVSTTSHQERGLLDRLRSSRLGIVPREQALALLGLFMLTTAACEKSEPELEPTPVVSGEIKPPLPTEILEDARLFQDKLITIDGYQNPIDIAGVTAEIIVAGNISLNALGRIVVDFQEINKSFRNQDITLFDTDTDPLSYIYHDRDHPKPRDDDQTFTVPGYQLSATYTSNEHCLELRNWVDGTSVFETEIPKDLTDAHGVDLFLSPSQGVDYFLQGTSNDNTPEPFKRMERYVVYSLGSSIDQLKLSSEQHYKVEELATDTPFLMEVAKLRQEYPNASVSLNGYTSSVSIKSGVSIERVRNLNNSIHAIEAVFSSRTGNRHLYPDSQSPTAAFTELRATASDGAELFIPRYHIEYTLDENGYDLHVVITDNVSGDTVVNTKVLYNIGEVEYTDEDNAHMDAETAAAEVEEAEVTTKDTAEEIAIARDLARIDIAQMDLDENVAAFAGSLTSALREDKVGMYQAYEKIRNARSYVTYGHDIQLLRVVEGNGMEQLRYLLMDKDFSISYSILPTSGFEQKEADTKHGFESGYNVSEYGGTLFVDGHLTNLELRRIVSAHSEDYQRMQAGVSMQRDSYGNMIFREVTYDAEYQWYNETLNIMLRLPATAETAGTMASVSVDLSAYQLGDYPELLKHVPDKPVLVVNERNADYLVYSRVKGLEVGKYKDQVEQIAAGAAEAEALFGFAPGELLRNIIIIDTDDVNAHYAYDKPTTIVINDEYLEHQPLADQWNVGFHETVHLITNKYQLDENSELVDLYQSLQSMHSSLLNNINEKNWFKGEITVGGHAQDNLAELLPSLIRSTLDPHLEESIRRLSEYSRDDYIKACEALAAVLDDVYSNYDTGTAKPTVQQKLREAAAIARRLKQSI